MRKELEAKNMELEKSNGELSSFNYIASHDLQEPLRKIVTFSELILQKDSGVISPASAGYFSPHCFSSEKDAAAHKGIPCIFAHG